MYGLYIIIIMLFNWKLLYRSRYINHEFVKARSVHLINKITHSAIKRNDTIFQYCFYFLSLKANVQ